MIAVEQPEKPLDPKKEAKKEKKRNSAEKLKLAPEEIIEPFEVGYTLNETVTSEPFPERKMAEQSASSLMLQKISPEQHDIAVKEKEDEVNKHKQLVENGDIPAGASAHGDQKSFLNQLLMKVAKRSLTKEDVRYTSTPVEGGIQAQCELTVRGETYVGEVKPNKKVVFFVLNMYLLSTFFAVHFNQMKNIFVVF